MGRRTDSGKSVEANMAGRNWVMDVVNLLLGLAGFVNIGVGTWRCIQGEVSGGGIIAAGLVLVLVATVDRFEVIKGLGLEAKTRAVDKKLVEVEHVLTQLRSLTEVFGSAMIRTASMSGRWGSSTPTREIYALVENIRSILAKLGADDNGIRPGLDVWAKVTANDVIYRILNPLVAMRTDKQNVIHQAMLANGKINFPDDPVQKTLLERAARLQQAYIEIDERWKWPLNEWISRLRKAIHEFPELTAGEREALLADFEEWAPEIDHIAQHRELKTPQKWLSRLENPEPPV